MATWLEMATTAPKFAGQKVFIDAENAWYIAKLGPSGRLVWTLHKRCGTKADKLWGGAKINV